MPENEEKIKTMSSVHPISNFLKLIFLFIGSSVISGIITFLYTSNYIINGPYTTDIFETQRSIWLVSFILIFATSYFVFRKYGKL